MQGAWGAQPPRKQGGAGGRSPPASLRPSASRHPTLNFFLFQLPINRPGGRYVTMAHWFPYTSPRRLLSSRSRVPTPIGAPPLPHTPSPADRNNRELSNVNGWLLPVQTFSPIFNLKVMRAKQNETINASDISQTRVLNLGMNAHSNSNVSGRRPVAASPLVCNYQASTTPRTGRPATAVDGVGRMWHP